MKFMSSKVLQNKISSKTIKEFYCVLWKKKQNSKHKIIKANRRRKLSFISQKIVAFTVTIDISIKTN